LGKGGKPMDVLQAIRERKSVRAFKPDPIPRETIEEILRLTIRAPSAVNIQPWEFFVVIDEEKDRLSRKLIKAYEERQVTCSPGAVKSLPQTYSQRGLAISEYMKPYLEQIGVSFEQFIGEGSCRFYGAPVAIIICLDDSFSKTRMVDIGIALGYLMLSAHSFGLATCPIGLIAAYEDEIKDLLNIPENKNVIIGVALGYPDWENPVNHFKPSRAKLDELVRWIE
jgi:nitroreductase